MLIDFKNKIFEGSKSRKSVYDCTIPLNPKGMIIFSHGYKGYKDWGAWNLVQDYFVAAGYGFLKFNFSHNGGTVENPIDFPDLKAFSENCFSFEVKDLKIMINEADRIMKQECNLNIPLHLIGHSRGGGVSILAGVKNPKVSSVISLAGISDIESRFPKGEDFDLWKREGVYFVSNNRTKQEMPHNISFYDDYQNNKSRLNIEKALEERENHFLQIHGDMDLVVSISEGQSLARWSDTEIEIIKGAGHTFGIKQPWENKEMTGELLEVCKKSLLFFENQSI